MSPLLSLSVQFVMARHFRTCIHDQSLDNVAAQDHTFLDESEFLQEKRMHALCSCIIVAD